MREIEFKGMAINGEWRFGLLSISQSKAGQPEAGYYISNKAGFPWAYQVRPETVGQWTGTKDKLGSKSYKGDIIEFYLEDKAYKDDIKFAYGMFYVNNPLAHGWRELPIWYFDEEYTIIGNIHEEVNNV